MGQMREAIDSFDEREVDRIEAIIHSMTPAERENPKIINGSRRARIAKGSGMRTTDVNQLLERFENAQKMMRQVSRGGGVPGMPGMGGLPGMGGGKKSRGRTQAPTRRAKGKSGNPAKRAEQERAAAARAVGGPTTPSAPGSAFGAGADSSPADLPGGLEDLELPDLGKYLGR
jgi:signal recognition particle subunit SRP54